MIAKHNEHLLLNLRNIRRTPLTTIIQAFVSGQLTSYELVNLYINRIKEVNEEFKAIIEISEAAPVIALQLDAQFTRHGRLSRLQGLPILLKDNICTTDDTNTTCGSFALLGIRPRREANIVTQLRECGAIILGKGNMAQWSGFRSTSGCSGWSARGGQCTGVYYKNMKPSGSSSGCAVAVALGLCAAAIGTETGFSIVSPAEKSGIVGFKPGRHMFSTEGLIFASRHHDTLGFLVRCVSDAKLMLEELCEPTMKTEMDKESMEHDLQSIRDLNLNPSSELYGIKVGIPINLLGLSAVRNCQIAAFETVLDVLRSAGADIVREINIPAVDTYNTLSEVEKRSALDWYMKEAVNEYLWSCSPSDHRRGIHDLQDLISFLKFHPREEYPSRNIAVLERAQNTTIHHFQRAWNAMCKIARQLGVAGCLDADVCDVLLLPGLSPTMQSLASHAGTPVVSVPMGKFPHDTPVVIEPANGLVSIAPGIPFSVYCFGQRHGHAPLLQVASVIEARMGIWEKLTPYLEPKTELASLRGSAVEPRSQGRTESQ